jgi:methylmalonyl-CoA/ethylmalonyl-CoA epimerase
MKDGDIIQIAHVVRDLDKAMLYYSETLGIGPWDLYDLCPPALEDSTVRGKPSRHTYRVGVSWLGGVQLELMQPLTGRSIYDECLETKGEVLHHMKLYFADCREVLARYLARGIPVIQSGRFGEDEFYYLDTEKSLGYVLEVGNNGKCPEPAGKYPA